MHESSPSTKRHARVTRIRAVLAVSLIVVTAFLFRGLFRSADDPQPSRGSDVYPASVTTEHPGIQHLIQVSDRLYSGSEPHGDAGFDTLRSLGVTVIVSVDGIAPDVARAAARGMRYVHVPIGYDGVSESARLQLTAIGRSVPGTIYIHCHHGRHRGPAAAAILARCRHHFDTDQALRLLKLAETGSEYPGLWTSVREFAPPADDVPLPEPFASADVPDFAAVMAALDRRWDRLKKLAAPATPIVPADVDTAALIVEDFRESIRLLKPTASRELREGLDRSSAMARLLVEDLRRRDEDSVRRRVSDLAKQCKDCHAQIRDVPGSRERR